MDKNLSWLLIFTFSPVQGFIVGAKKTKDLFAGSYLLSFLTYKVLLNLKRKLNGDLEIIYPILDNPSKDLHHLMVGNYPNRFVVLVRNKQKGEIKEIIAQAKRCFCNEIQNIATKVEQDFITNSINELEKYPCKVENIPNLITAKEQLQKQIEDYFQAFVVAKVVLESDLNSCKYKDNYETTEKILGGRKTFRSYKGWADFSSYQTDEKSCHFPDGCTTCSERLSLAIDWNKAKLRDIAEGEKLCGLCYGKRRLGEIYLSNPNTNLLLQNIANDSKKLEEIKLLFTRFPSTHDIALSKEKFEFWKVLVEINKNSKYDKENLQDFIEELRKTIDKFRNIGIYSYGINIFYRRKLEELLKDWIITDEDLKKDSYWKEVLKENKNLEKEFKEILKTPWNIEAEFLSTDYLERLKYKEEIDGESINRDILENYIKILKQVFKAIKEFTGRDFEKEFNKAPYFGIMYSDGDNIGKILGGEKEFIKKDFNKNFHIEFSKKLSEYAKHVAVEIEKGPDNGNENESSPPGFAKIIYAGGDDVFAFLHPSEITRALRVTSQRYKEFLQNLLVEEKATTSAGVVLGHAKVSLKYLLKKAREAEKIAKNTFGRNAFVIKVISRSGEETTFGSKYSYSQGFRPLDLLEELIKLYQRGLISSKLPYTIREIALKYFTYRDKKTREQISEIAKILLKRELKRKINLQEEEKEKLEGKILDLFECQMRAHTELGVGEILRNIGGMFYVARELSKWG